MKTVQDVAIKLLEDSEELHYQRITLGTATSLHRLASGDKGDFVIFNNSGGMPFTVWSGGAVQGIVHSSMSNFVYAYRLGGNDVLVKLPLLWKGNFDWIPAERYEAVVEEAMAAENVLGD